MNSWCYRELLFDKLARFRRDVEEIFCQMTRFGGVE